jgi:hypothetical protein
MNTARLGFLLVLVAITACSPNNEETPPDTAVQLANSTGAAADPDAALVARAQAPLFDGMGPYHRAISTAEPGAQRYFDQGMVLAFGFNHAESIRSFRAAQRLDPN